MFDFGRGAKTSGSKFYFNVGSSALLEWKLIGEMIEFHCQRGYTFVIPPNLIREETARQAGILPRFEGDFYKTEDGLILIPTAETPLVGFHSDEILKEEDLPIKYVAFSPCFRREGGAHGARDKGLRRVHQFHKVELFIICKPEDSDRLHREMLQQVQSLIECNWGLEYRVLELSETDRSPMSAKTFDIELKYGEEWLEVSSISNTEDRQAKLAQIRYKNKNGKNVKCHLLNGSGLALPRLMLVLTKEGAE